MYSTSLEFTSEKREDMMLYGLNDALEILQMVTLYHSLKEQRISVGSSDANVMGTCLCCGCSFDDYSSRCRCTYCRMLVLVCDTCQKKQGAEYVCELCQKHGKIAGSVPCAEKDRSKTSLPVELEGVSISSHSAFTPQLRREDGKVPSLQENSESCASTGFGRMPPVLKEERHH